MRSEGADPDLLSQPNAPAPPDSDTDKSDSDSD